MRLASFDPELEPRLRALAKALGRLEEPQGRVARRNARAEVRKAEKALTRAVDKLYPAQRKAPKKRRKRWAPGQQVAELKRNGWAEVHRKQVLARLSSLGIRVKRILLSPTTGHALDRHEILAPEWAVLIANLRPRKLAVCKRSLRERRAVLTEIALETGDDT